MSSRDEQTANVVYQNGYKENQRVADTAPSIKEYAGDEQKCVLIGHSPT